LFEPLRGPYAERAAAFRQSMIESEPKQLDAALALAPRVYRRPLAPQDAARSVRAVFAALSGESWWRGVFWWKAFSDGSDAGSGDASFNFLGRPAGEAIAAGFRRLAAAEGARR